MYSLNVQKMINYKETEDIFHEVTYLTSVKLLSSEIESRKTKTPNMALTNHLSYCFANDRYILYWLENVFVTLQEWT